MSSPAAPLACPAGPLVVSVLTASSADTVFAPLFVWVMREVMVPPLFVAWCYRHLHLSSFLL
eukprot:5576547-Amphidinium_carterae.1